MGFKNRTLPQSAPQPAPEPETPEPVKDTAALKAFAERIDKYAKVEKIDNSRLYAGSPMTYYCRMCGGVSATLPEGHWGSPPRHCTPCQELLDATGLTPTTLIELAQDYREETA